MKNVKVGTINKIFKNVKGLTSNLKFEMSESHVSPFIIKKPKKSANTFEPPKERLRDSKIDLQEA